MRSLRFHLEQDLTVGEEITLTGPNHHHLAKVLRLRPGATIELFNGDGLNYRGQISALDGRSCRVLLEGATNPHNESPLALTLLLALIKGEAFERALQKAVELGVKRIVPVHSERCAAKGLKRERCRGILIASAMQCGRAVVPELTELSSLAAALERWGPGWICSPHHQSGVVADGSPHHGCDVVADGSPHHQSGVGAAGSPHHGGERASSQPPQGEAGALALAIGPEGGFSDGEVARAQRLGWQPRRLGPRILRADTAATVALAQAQMLQGDLDV